MKKILIFLFLLVILAVGALAYFIATFDADRYIPLVQQKLEEVLGNPVKIGHLSLTWSGGIAFELRQLEVYPSRAPGAPPVLQLEKADALLKFAPLLQKDIEVGSLRLIHPALRIRRDPQGEVVIVGINPPRGGSSSGAGTAAASLPFLIDTVKIEDAKVVYTDETLPEPLQIEMKKIDIDLKNVSLIHPISFEVRAAVMSGEQNIRAEGRFVPPFGSRAAAIEGLRFETDLAKINTADLSASFPQLAGFGIQGPLRGSLTFESDRMGLDPQGLENLVAKAHLANGEIRLTDAESPIQNINAELVMQNNRAQLKAFSAAAAGGKISGSGAVDRPFTQPSFVFETTGGTFSIGDLIPETRPDEPRFEGRLAFGFNGTAFGSSEPAISQSLAGQGQVDVQEPVILNFNLLREVFNRLSVLPGLVRRLEQNLPPSYLEKLEARDTVLGPVDLPLKAERGIISFPNLQIVSDTFRLTGNGAARINGPLDFRLMLAIDPELSKAMIQSVQELQYLANAEGWLEIPLMVQGTMEAPRVFPDLQYVASRLAVVKTRELLGELLQKKSPPTGTPSTTPATGQANPADGTESQPPSWGSLLGTLLQQTTKNDSSAQGSTSANR